MKHDQQDIDRFFEPWRFPNDFGIPEVDEEDIEVLERIGSGKKASTRKAKWNGRMIALKSWHPNQYEEYSEDRAFSYYELSRYNDLKKVQGKLIPELYFVSRSKTTGKIMLGLELGEPVTERGDRINYHMRSLRDKLKMAGHVQRSASFRRDNVVWMKNDDGSRRLVAIDLESFHSHFGYLAPKERIHTSEPRMTIFGIPEISMSEVRPLRHGQEHSMRYLNFAKCWKGSWKWNDRNVTILGFDHKERENFLKEMRRIARMSKKHGDLIARPLFITRLRYGMIILGLEHFEEWDEDTSSEEELLQTMGKMSSALMSEGYRMHHFSVGKIVGGDERPIVYCLGNLQRIRPKVIRPDQFINIAIKREEEGGKMTLVRK